MIDLSYNLIGRHIPLGDPIKTISLSTPDKSLSDLIMTITWDCGAEIRHKDMEDNFKNKVKITGWSCAADTIIRIPLAWSTPQYIEDLISEIGWYLGAGYMYRWHKAPGKACDYFFGCARYTCAGEDSQHGDDGWSLLADADKCGYWTWEINTSYLKRLGTSKIFWPSWRKHDSTLTNDGTRDDDWQGWDGTHNFYRATDLNTGYESQFFYYRPKKYNKNIHVLANKKNKTSLNINF
ncbi:MAG: hypothetical protein JRJ39_00120 [Deltaproteobacteria bacterium]|nr:hypothetical protein [Deltaproteobacteria bacterium]